MPFVTSMTSIIRSMIWAPPMMVRMREACPGQSTRVNWRFWRGKLPVSRSGIGTEKDEKPKSKVMPLSLLCGCLSSAAVDNWVDSAATAAAQGTC